MSLQFVMGPSGSGKSHYLYEWVTNESLQHPDKNYVVLVPEQFTMQTQRDLVMASPRKGILNVEVQSFHRLAKKVFEEVGETNRVVLDDIGKNFVIRKIAGEQQGELRVLGNNLKKLGYISEIKSIISEFTQYDIQPETIGRLLEHTESNSALYYKMQDIKKVYEGFQAYLREKYITGEEILDVLAQVANKSNFLKNSVLVLDGFTGFTPVQNKLLRQLLVLCEQVLVTVTMDSRENPYVYHHPYQLFAMGKQMVVNLSQIARECQCEIKQPVCLYDAPVYRFRNNEALGFMESHIFRYSKDTFEKEQDAIAIYRCKNPHEEVDFVAQTIRRLVRTKEYRYRDLAVITNGMDVYANHIERVFAQYDIPVFVDYKRSILLNSCVEYIRSLLAMAEQNFTYESVFRYLRTGLSGLAEDEVDILENYVVALGIRGYKKWQEKWIRKTRDMDEETLVKVNEVKDRLINSVESVMEVLKSRKKTVRHVTEALHNFFVQEELQQHVKNMQLQFEEKGEIALAKEYGQVYGIVISLLDQLVELLGDETISLKEYCELLDSGLEETKVGVIPPGVDQVVVGDLERSRIQDVKTVFLLGVNDSYIPGSVGNGGLLSEYDRSLMTEQGMSLAPNMKEKIYIQKFYLYLILTKPKNQVYLTYSNTSSDGKSQRPSYLVSEFLKMFPKLKVKEQVERLSGRELTKDIGIRYLVAGLQQKDGGLSEEWQELYTWYKKQPEWKNKLEQIIEATFYEKPKQSLSQEMAKQLYGEVLQNSVSRLEQFSKCAYSHFLKYGLGLKEREEYRFESIDMGNLFHSAIEKFSYKLEKAGYTWNNLPMDKQEEFIGESVDECITDYGNSILYSSARNTYIIARLQRMLSRTVWALRKQLEKGDFVPSGYEISFGGRKGPAVSCVDLGELGELRLKGKIDRIDLCVDEDKVFVKVIDYKTGSQTFDWNKLCYGLQLQLVVYLNAAMEIEKKEYPDKEIIPAGLFYYQMKDPIVEKGTNTEDAILEELCPDGILQRSSNVVQHMDRQFTAKSQVIPVSKNKDGELRGANSLLSSEEFRVISEHANQKVREIGTHILEGVAEVAPYELEGKTGCEYCPYQTVCGFEEKLPGYEYRHLEKKNKEEILENMRKEVEPWE